MNTYITDSLKRIKIILLSNDQPSSESIDAMIGELEMMKMEIEQHITNMPQNEKYKNIRCSAENTVQKLSEILDLLEELPYDKKLVCEIIELIDEINY
jgi:hypothetical protein